MRQIPLKWAQTATTAPLLRPHPTDEIGRQHESLSTLNTIPQSTSLSTASLAVVAARYVGTTERITPAPLACRTERDLT